MASHCESSPGSFNECRLSARWLPTLKPRQSTWAANLPEKAATIRMQHRHLLLVNARADNHLPSHRGWKAESESTYRHCSEGVQPVPKCLSWWTQLPAVRWFMCRFEPGSSDTAYESAVQPLDHCDLASWFISTLSRSILTVKVTFMDTIYSQALKSCRYGQLSLPHGTERKNREN